MINIKINRIISKFLRRVNLFFPFLEFPKWLLIDFLEGKWLNDRIWGIYNFVALPGQGKTMSMTAHIERLKKNYPNIRIYTNYWYKYQTAPIEHWSDMIKYAKECVIDKVPCVLAIDEVHITFDSSDWKSFPSELLALLSFNRKFNLQFLCTSQIFERIPKKIRDISNYTVICKNTLGLDRHFKNYYFHTLDYDAGFAGKRAKADFIRSFVATDYYYSLYDTYKQVDKMGDGRDKTEKEKAFELLFGDVYEKVENFLTES